jgi:hypothetical protein
LAAARVNAGTSGGSGNAGLVDAEYGEAAQGPFFSDSVARGEHRQHAAPDLYESRVYSEITRSA